MWRRTLVLSAICVAGCGEEPAAPGAPPPVHDVDAGVPGCPAGTAPVEDGCKPAGVQPGSCAPGFVADGDGCEPVLPPRPCAPGLMAVPGETACREVSPCAAGTWGDAPADPGTIHVDAGYDTALGPSDGSAAHPYGTVQDGVDHAGAGATVAIAAGVYIEGVLVSKPARLWGRCPAMVTLQGPAAELAAVLISADGVEVHGIAIRGSTVGIGVSGATGVAIERTWVHDTGGRGIVITDELGESEVTVRDSLIESVHDLGLIASAAALTVERTNVRGTLPTARGFGRGIDVQDDPLSSRRATLAVGASVIEDSRGYGVFVRGADAVVEGSVVRATRLDPVAGDGGHGLYVRDADAGGDATATVRGSLVEGSCGAAALVFGAHLTVESTVVRGGAPAGCRPRGLDAEIDPATGVRGMMLVRESVVSGCDEFGVFAEGSDVTIESAIVRDTAPSAADQSYGRGVSVREEPSTGQRSTLALRWSRVERNRDTGVFVQTADATLDGTLVSDTKPQVSDGEFGRGIQVQLGATAEIAGVVVERSAQAGICAIDATATVAGSIVRDTAKGTSGSFGDGIIGASVAIATSVTVTASRVERSARVGITSFGASIAASGTVLDCNPIDLDGEGAFTFDDLGSNVCGCGEDRRLCKVLTSELEPPPPAGN